MTKILISTVFVGLYTVIDILLFYTITQWWVHIDPTLAAVIVIGAGVNNVRYKIENLKGTETR